MSESSLYKSSTLEVVATVSDELRFKREGAKLVTFESLARGPNRPPFGSKFATKYGVDALHVIPVGDDWYQYPDLDDCLKVVVASTAAGATVSGASMGGFAATTFADAIHATKSIAIAPQLTIQSRKVPFETRWQKHAAKIEFRDDDDFVAQNCHHYVFYDPKCPDQAHATLIAERAKQVTLVEVKGGGHMVAVVLAESGCLSSVTQAVMNGEPTSHDLVAMIGPHLRKSAHHLYFLATQSAPAEREALLRSGLEIDGENLKLRHGMARALHALNRPDEALPQFEFVLKRRPFHAKYREQYLEACKSAGISPRDDILNPPDRVAARRAERLLAAQQGLL